MKTIDGIWILVDKHGKINLLSLNHQDVEDVERKFSSIFPDSTPYSIIPLKGIMEKEFEIHHKPCYQKDECGHRWAKWININDVPWEDFFTEEVRQLKPWWRRAFSSETHDVTRVLKNANWYRHCFFCGKKEFRLEV